MPDEVAVARYPRISRVLVSFGIGDGGDGACDVHPEILSSLRSFDVCVQDLAQQIGLNIFCVGNERLLIHGWFFLLLL